MEGAARIKRPKADSNGAPITCEDNKPFKYISDVTKIN
jgi:hypothetical protein